MIGVCSRCMRMFETSEETANQPERLCRQCFASAIMTQCPHEWTRDIDENGIPSLVCRRCRKTQTCPEMERRWYGCCD